MEIILTCCICCGHKWEPLDDGAFRCMSCGEIMYTEDMCAMAMEEKENDRTNL